MVRGLGSGSRINRRRRIEIDEELAKKLKEQEACRKQEQAEADDRFYSKLADRYNMPAWIRLDKRLIDEYRDRYVSTWIMLTIGRLLYYAGLPDGNGYKSTIADAGLTAGEYWQLQKDSDFGMKPEEDQ